MINVIIDMTGMYGNTIFDKLKVFVCKFIKTPVMFFF